MITSPAPHQRTDNPTHKTLPDRRLPHERAREPLGKLIGHTIQSVPHDLIGTLQLVPDRERPAIHAVTQLRDHLRLVLSDKRCQPTATVNGMLTCRSAAGTHRRVGTLPNLPSTTLLFAGT